jgi:N-methylhydantoinase B/oxoprolinase/acetone carboxylase alpha subunit
LYVYVGNNPLKWVDPWGLSKDIIVWNVTLEWILWAIIWLEYAWDEWTEQLYANQELSSRITIFLNKGGAKVENLSNAWKKVIQKTEEQIQKSIKSLEKRLEEHKKELVDLKNWIYKFTKKVKGDADKYTQWLIKYREKEIKSIENKIINEKNILKNLLK